MADEEGDWGEYLGGEAAFDTDADGEAEVVLVDTDADAVADVELIDTNEDNVADVELIDTDNDHVIDTVVPLAETAEPSWEQWEETTEEEANAIWESMGYEPTHSSGYESDLPNFEVPPEDADITEDDVERASEDMDAQSHIGAGMNEMYNAIYH